MGLATRLPWWFKIGAKFTLARLPIPYGLWKRLGIFRHGQMMLPHKAIRAYEGHAVDLLGRVQLPDGFHVLELGPGDSVLSGFVATAKGAGKSWLVDAGSFAEFDVETSRDLVRGLGASPAVLARLTGTTQDELLRQANIVYLTEGTRSMAQIPDGSVHYCWSQVVLEHIYRSEFARLMAEMRRVMVPGGICIHSIDFRDHLGGGLNNLRIGDDIWEVPVFRDSGFYTNRIRPREMFDMMRAAGFTIEVIAEKRWPEMPIARRNLAPQFRDLPDEDFMVCEVKVALRPL